MSVPPESNYLAWLGKASHDVLNITNNLLASQIPWDTVCFHAQQAVEKSLKAFLVFHGLPLLRSHDLVAILAACASADPTLAVVEPECRELTYFAVGARYPEDLFEPTEEDGRRMILACERVREHVIKRLPQ